MTRDEFVSLHLDEMTGLLLAAFRVADPHKETDRGEPLQFARIGAAFLSQQRRARDLLGRLYDSATQAKPAARDGGVNGKHKPQETKA